MAKDNRNMVENMNRQLTEKEIKFRFLSLDDREQEREQSFRLRG